MTAYVNRKHSKKVAAVVTASLVGALSLGIAAPAFAVTEGETDVTIDNIFQGSTFTWNVQPQKDGQMVVEAGTPLTLQSITDINGRTIPLRDVIITYKNAAGRTLTDPEDWSYAGNYTVTVEYKLTHDVYTLDFTVKGLSLSKAEAFQGNDIADDTFTYTGFDFNDTDDADDNGNIHFTDGNGNVLTSSDVDVKFYNASGSEVTSIVNAGNYTAVLTAKKDSKYEGSKTVNFTVDKLDLDGAKITIEPVVRYDDSFTVNASGS